MDGVFSPEKNDTKISHFGSAVLILEHVKPSHVGFKNSLSSASNCLQNMTKGLTIMIVRVNEHSLHQRRSKECPLTEPAHCIIAQLLWRAFLSCSEGNLRLRRENF